MKTLIPATALSCLAMLGGCYQAETDAFSMGRKIRIEERTITDSEEDLWIGRGLAIGTAGSRDAGAPRIGPRGAEAPAEAINAALRCVKICAVECAQQCIRPSALNQEQAADVTAASGRSSC
jgi:hypothetical protein